MKKIIYCSLLSIIVISCIDKETNHNCHDIWSEKNINTWYNEQDWIVGCNYITSSAVNQLEMWQSDTFDPNTINKELNWAKDLGFNSMRVFLHSLVWLNDSVELKKRIDEYLSISSKNGIKTTLVLFDDCWNPETRYGRQPEPKVGIHNSGWVQDPIVSMRKDTTTLYYIMENYVKDIISTFKNDDRILMWDLYNEPGNSGHINNSLPLLKKVFKWAREINPSQPLTAGIWDLDLHDLNKYQLENSDIITYHCYLNKDRHSDWINWMRLYKRPLICTEWMSRKFNSTFELIMPVLKSENIGAYCWGFVAGKTNTIFGWNDPRPDGKEPDLWFHDILRRDGTPFSQDEIKIIKSLTSK